MCVCDKRDRLLSPIDFHIQKIFNSEKLESERIKPINDDINVYANSINAFIGGCGSGKSGSATTEIIKLTHYCCNVHMVIVATKNDGTDDTFKELEHLIGCSLLKIREVELEDFMKKILLYKQLYNDIKDDHLEKRITAQQKQDIFNVLLINNFDQPSIQTIIFLPDSANSLLFKAKRKITDDALCQNYFVDHLIKEHRHRDISTSFFICAQKINNIPTDVRANCDMFFIFNGYNRHELSLIRQYVYTDLNTEELWELYSQLANHEKLIFNKYSKEIIIDA
jgi:hypothetical protein